jgi:Flp pilus assembly protein TadG
MARLAQLLKNNRGQTLVELALLLPILVLLVFGILEFGRVFNETLVVTAAAREGARVAAVNSDNDAAAVDAVKQVAAAIDHGRLTIDISPTGPRAIGSEVTVQVTNQVPIVTPLIGAFFAGNSATVSGTTSMRQER